MNATPAIASTPAELRWEAVSETSERHAALADFIKGAYRQHFGASLFSLMPELCALIDVDGLPRAVAGFRQATEQPLFLEQYLSSPVERQIAAATGEAVHRSAIWEVGNLATRCPGAARYFVHRAAVALAERGAEWAVFTGTRRVVAVFRRLGLPLITLAQADPSRLQEDAGHWGTYYQHAPRVVAGRISLALQGTSGTLQ